MYSIGIDAGSTYTKGVLFDGENISKKLIIPTGSSPKSTSKEVYEYLTKDIDNSQIKKVVGTGYGRISMDFIDKKVSDSLYNNYDNNLDLYENSEYLKEIHFDELYDFVMNKAKVWPDKNSVYISDNCIIVIFDEDRLDYLREKIKNVKF